MDETKVSNFIKAIKPGKATDVYDLTSEHIKLAPPQLVSIIIKLINMIISKCKLPGQFEIRAITPTQKNKKPIKNSGSYMYHRITVGSNLGKLVEKMMSKLRSEPATKAKQDPMQFGFTAKDNSNPLYITFLDSSLSI